MRLFFRLAIFSLGITLLLPTVLVTAARQQTPQPRYIAFSLGISARHADLYVMEADGGKAKPLIAGAEPHWLQGDQWLSYLNFDPNSYRWNLHRLRLNDQRVDNISAQLGYSYEPLESQFSWSADGQRLIFAEYRKNRDLFQVLLQNGTLSQVTQGDKYATYPVWSPDGGWVAFLSAGDIYLVRPNGQELRRLTQAGTFENPLFWSPDGRRLATVSPPAFGQRITLIAIKDGEITTVTNDPIRADPAKLAWSPDSQWIAFTTHNQTLYKVATSGSTPVLIKTGINFTPDWSPDGAWIVFIGRDTNNSEDVYRITPDGRILERLFAAPPGAVARNPVWSPAVEVPQHSLPLIASSLILLIAGFWIKAG